MFMTSTVFYSFWISLWESVHSESRLGMLQDRRAG